MTELTVYQTSLALEDTGRTLILGHVNPDGDCLGSACALREIIAMRGGSADVACDGLIPDRLTFICSDALSFEDVKIDGYDTVISVDVASPGQLGRFAEYIPRIALMIDHHGTGEPYADNLVVPEASAAGEIVYDIYRELLLRGKIHSDVRVMRFIYSAIVSDTGSFKFSNTTPRTLAAASELCAGINSAQDGGLDTADLCRLLFGRFTEREMKAKMLAIQNMRFYENGRLGLVLFTKATLDGNGLDDGDIGNAVDTPRCIDGVYVALSVRETGNKVYKISSRANVDVDCAAVCASFGGGGHTRAAGCSVEADSPEKAVEIAVEAFGEAVREYAARANNEKVKI